VLFSQPRDLADARRPVRESGGGVSCLTFRPSLHPAKASGRAGASWDVRSGEMFSAAYHVC